MPTLVSALDLGQTTDHTALATVEKSAGRVPVYSVRRLIRFDLRTPYPEIVRRVCDLHVPGRALAGCSLVIDQTGVGRPVVEMFAEAGVNAAVYPVTITGGNQWKRDESGDYRVPKQDLAGVLQMLMPSDRLKAAPNLGLGRDGDGQNLTGLLVEEMQNFRVKVSKQAHEIYGAREGKHDDIVLAVALACWAGENLHLGAWDMGGGKKDATLMSRAPKGVFGAMDLDDTDDDEGNVPRERGTRLS